MKKLIVCLTATFLIGSVNLVGAEFKSQYNNSGGYNQMPYSNVGGYDNTGGYDNLIDYRSEFIKGEQRQQMVQKTDSRGRTVQAVVPVGTPDSEIEKGD